MVLLIASLIFYGTSEPVVLGLAVLSSFFAYKTGLLFEITPKIERKQREKAFSLQNVSFSQSAPGFQRILLFAAILVLLLPLLYYKYAPAIVPLILPESLQIPGLLPSSSGSKAPSILVSFVIPAGISFWTFQLIAYVVDVSSGRIQAERSFFPVLQFTLFFPQLIAGPIERAEHLIPKLKRAALPSPIPEEAILLFIQGLFKKVFVADHLATITGGYLQGSDHALEGGALFAGIVFALQVYSDFAGYTDMARGVALAAGIRLSENFQRPFFASSPGEIWRRWHITLMAFFRDYVYIPLGGSRSGTGRQFFIILFVFALGGIWHGSSAGMIAWGLFSGLTVALDALIRPGIARMPPGPLRWIQKIAGTGITFLLFSAGASLMLSDLNHMGDFLFSLATLEFSPDPVLLASVLYLVAPLFLMELWQELKKDDSSTQTGGPANRTIAAFQIGLILFLGRWESSSFIYFQF